VKVPKKDSAILEWVEKNNIHNSRNIPFEFDKHSYLLDPMCDWSREIGIMKSAQIGFSESFGILKAVFAADYFKLDSIYTLTSNQAAEDFVRQKVNPIIDKNPVIRNVVSQHMLDLKQVGDRFLRFRGTHSSETADKRGESDKGITITSDLNIHDEHDRSDQFVIDQYASRLENSDYGGIWSFSNPTVPGVGCSRIWEESDQKRWTVKCTHCGHYQYLDWVKLGEVTGITDHCKIDIANREFVCGKCEKTITDTDRIRGQWVAIHPDREISGYWMGQMNYVHHNVDGIYKKELKRTPQNFYNMVLGKPYRSSTASIDRGMIIKNLSGAKNQKKQVWMGIDQGIKKHYVIGDEEGVFEYGVTDDWKDIEALINKYQATFVVDARPRIRDAQKLVQKYSRGDGPRGYMCYYQSESPKSQVIEWGTKKNRGIVYVQREPAFDMLVDLFVNQMYPITMLENRLDQFIAHWNTLNRIDKEDSLGSLRPKWESSTGMDHYAHATMYQWVASMKSKGLASIGESMRRSAIETKPGIEVSDEWTSALPGLTQILNENNGRSTENYIG
jgi:DNA-directed RNA polymerase subunit RPC12/RpoP